MDSQRISCVVADDHPALLAAVSDFLEEHGYDVVAACANGRDALAAVRAFAPAIAVLDYRMPGGPGAELIKDIVAASANTRIVVYTGDGTTELAAEVLGAGARAILLKQAPLDDLLRALRAAGSGARYVDPLLAPDSRSANVTLTKREQQVLELVAEGLGQQEIGRRLSIGTETVRAHLQKVRKRLSATTSTQAVAIALRLGLLQ
ncbi:MAG: response regulator transcription factor [Actinomycetota bacterium]|nr:response regulator transcription factor [Actinomycetota bacterium]